MTHVEHAPPNEAEWQKWLIELRAEYGRLSANRAQELPGGVDVTSHPLLHALHMLCVAVERIPPSVEQTALSVLASEVLRASAAIIAEVKRLRAELAEVENAEPGRYCVSCGVFMGDEPSACVDEVVCDICAEGLDEDDEETDDFGGVA